MIIAGSITSTTTNPTTNPIVSASIQIELVLSTSLLGVTQHGLSLSEILLDLDVRWRPRSAARPRRDLSLRSVPVEDRAETQEPLDDYPVRCLVAAPSPADLRHRLPDVRCTDGNMVHTCSVEIGLLPAAEPRVPFWTFGS